MGAERGARHDRWGGGGASAPLPESAATARPSPAAARPPPTRAVSAAHPGSQRRPPARVVVATPQHPGRRQRRDVHRQTALALVRPYDTLAREDRRVAHLGRNRHLAKALSDAGWAALRPTLAYQAVCAGKHGGGGAGV